MNRFSAFFRKLNVPFFFFQKEVSCKEVLNVSLHEPPRLAIHILHWISFKLMHNKSDFQNVETSMKQTCQPFKVSNLENLTKNSLKNL